MNIKNPELFKNRCNCVWGHICTAEVDWSECNVHGLQNIKVDLKAFKESERQFKDLKTVA